MQEITVHTRLTTGASKEAVNLDYLNHIRDAIIRSLINGAEGVDEAVKVMNHYHLLRYLLFFIQICACMYLYIKLQK